MMTAKRDRHRRIDRASGITLWRQVADFLRQSIANGEHDERMMLPPEKEIAAYFEVNRHTVRSALFALAEDGVVRPVQGIGTMICRTRKIKLPLTRRTRFSESVGAQAKVKSAILLSHRLEAANGEVANALGIEEGTSCIVLETTHNADGVPVSTATNWFEAARFHQLPEKLHESGSISAALAACGVPDYTRHSTEISAFLATSEDMQRLRLSIGAIVIETKAINTDAANKAIQFSRSRFDAARSSLVISFDAQTTA